MKKEMVCIVCPMSCHMAVTIEKNKVTEVSGNTCPRGSKYAKEELTNPTRMLTSTVVIKNARIPRCPVVTSEAIPKKKMRDVMKQINKVKIKAPVNRDDIIIENVARTGVNIIASRTLEAVKK